MGLSIVLRLTRMAEFLEFLLGLTERAVGLQFNSAGAVFAVLLLLLPTTNDANNTNDANSANEANAGSETCLSLKNSVSDECCYKKCSICGSNQMQDLEAKVLFDGRNISCLQLLTVTTLDVAFDSDDFSNLKSAFTDTCCYDKTDTPWIMCDE